MYRVCKYISLAILVSVFVFPQDIKETTEELIKEQFGSDAIYKFEKYKLTKSLKSSIEKKAKQRFFDDEIYLYRIYDKNDLKGYAVLDNVYGKSLPITFLVMFNVSGDVLSSHIVKYREPYGGAVKSERWNDQFVGLNAASEFKVGDNIDSISGATISVNSVTKGIMKTALLIEEIIKNDG